MADKEIVIYTLPTCADCHAAKRYFTEVGVQFLEKDCTTNSAYPKEVYDLTQKQTVPTIVIDEQVFVGFTDHFEQIQQLVKS
ncbi:Glutaredoxin [Seinonella peptonophila]|uniref:Glutaredoxin n=1 Tax=Seinonella peptonophila TaxID=112248 RepID=A0A1M5BMJ5_9BACL|nr:glutaredoxin family protein [Seinonella peptonophila]SHF43437.1 Glutaredoxin [Seinonella peptonophila]